MQPNDSPSSDEGPLRPTMLSGFIDRWRADDRVGMASFLVTDATLLVDGGGHLPVPTHEVQGAARVAAALADVSETTGATLLEERRINGSPGVVLRDGDDVVAVALFSFANSRIVRAWVVANPSKLGHWNRR